ncbi:MAG: hypothetical protein LBH12_07325 [Dysgonamonadaceae bacterium]|jgi:hypothetical protein|nr:hypothetical protein [Dysgonamonadaceae bacterium]
MELIILKNKKIDKQKYDTSIRESLNGTVYAASWYLDTIFPDWQLITTPDYSFVMPLTLKRKYGIACVLQPILCQQLGIFSKEKITQEVIDLFLSKISAPYCHIHLNAGNQTQLNQSDLRANYVLNLNEDYEIIKNNYRKDTKDRLKKIEKNNLLIDKELDTQTVLKLVKKSSPVYGMNNLKIYESLKKIVTKAEEKGLLLSRGVKDKVSDDLIAVTFFIRWENTIYYICSYSSEEGKKRDAIRFLFDDLIKEFSGKNKILDFEGSVIQSIALFYISFGAKAVPYPVYHRNCFFRFIKMGRKYPAKPLILT